MQQVEKQEPKPISTFRSVAVYTYGLGRTVVIGFVMGFLLTVPGDMITPYFI
jgi:hypothetical protein